MRRRLSTTVSLLALLSGTALAEDLSLKEALDRVAKSPRAEASQAGVSAASGQVEMATGRLQPTVTISHGYMRTDNPVGVFSAKLEQARFSAADFAIPDLNDPSSVNHWRTRFEVAQPIFHGTTDWRNRQAAQSQESAEKWQHEARLQSLRLQVTQIYRSIVALDLRLRIVDEGIERLEALEKSYQLMAAPTSATTTNFLITQSVRLHLQAERSGLEEMQSEWTGRLTSLLGISRTQLRLTDPLPEVPTTVPDSDTAVQERAGLKASSLRVEAARKGISAVHGEWWPNLDLMAGYNLYTGNYSSMETAYDLGVLLTWPIFQGSRGGRSAEAAARLTGARETERAERLEAEAALENARMAWSARIREYRLLQEAEKKAAEAIDLAKKRYAQGSLPLFDYSQSIQNWIAVRQNGIETQRRVAEAKAQLDFERGAL